MARRPAWPEDTVFRRPVLDVESDSSEHCGATLHVCDHRFHRIHTLQGPVELPCRLAHCSDCLCPLRCQTLRRPRAEVLLRDSCHEFYDEYEKRRKADYSANTALGWFEDR